MPQRNGEGLRVVGVGQMHKVINRSSLDGGQKVLRGTSEGAKVQRWKIGLTAKVFVWVRKEEGSMPSKREKERKEEGRPRFGQVRRAELRNKFP